MFVNFWIREQMLIKRIAMDVPSFIMLQKMGTMIWFLFFWIVGRIERPRNMILAIPRCTWRYKKITILLPNFF